MYNPFRKPDLYLVRHADTDDNDKDVYRGWADPPINDTGMQQVEMIANYFSFEQVGKVVAADRQRHHQTAEMGVLPYSALVSWIEPNTSLRGWNVGDFQGQPRTAENKKKLKYYIQHPEIPTPNGESRNEFMERWEGAFQHYLLQSATLPYPTVLVTSSSCIVATHQMISGDGSIQEVIAPGGICKICVDEKGVPDMQYVLGEIVGEVSGQGANTPSS